MLLRSLDVLLSSVFLLLALPVALPIALVVLLTSGRPIFYRGERVGRGGRVFTMLKFRTLRADAESRLGPYLGEELVRRTQAEFTTIGRWLKATQLDEIPQFLNVLRGDMSLVGPRPIRPVFFEELAHELPAYWQRLIVRPGLTGLAQVRRGYETSMAEKLAHDLEWIADRSVRLYLRTVLPAVGGILSGQPSAYRYLSDTVDSYRTPAELRDMAAQAGWSDVRFRALAFGTVGILSGKRVAPS